MAQNNVRETLKILPVVGQNLAALSHGAGKAAYSREYGLVQASAMSNEGG